MNNLLERFLIYSLQHRRAIKVMLMLDEKPQSLNLSVQSMEEDGSLEAYKADPEAS